MTPSGTVAIKGGVARGYEDVRDAFAHNFEFQQELGAAFAVYRGEECVVDLWHGVADRGSGRLWDRDTLQLIFSGTKGLVAVCVLMLVDRCELDLDDPLCKHWPEFGRCGKTLVSVRDVVSHAARLPGLQAPVTIEDVLNDRHMAQLLARQSMLDDPRARHAYHALTYGWLCGELVRRIDGRSVGRFFADEVAGPLGLEIFIGLPAHLEGRVSRLELAESWGTAPVFDPRVLAGDALIRAIWGNPPLFGPGELPWNEARIHQAEIPAANGIGTARAIAKLYANLDRLLSPEAIALGRTPIETRRDAVLGEDQVFGVGFELQSARKQFGPPAVAFGHTGAGGSTHGAWPEHELGFSYAMNLMRDDQPDGDTRAAALLESLAGCLGAR